MKRGKFQWFQVNKVEYFVGVREVDITTTILLHIILSLYFVFA